MAQHQLIPSFNAGELSPYLDARSDLEKYASGCRLLENFVIMPYGGVYRRPGTEYLGVAKHANKRCRLLGFNFSTTTRFILEMGEHYIRFWSNGQPVIVGGVPLEVATPYEESQLREIQFIQINDVMYFVHPLHAPRKLTRRADDDWTFAEITWDWPALLDENIEPTTITPYPNVVTAWLTATTYAVGDHVTQSSVLYRCLSAHTSGTFSTDLTANRWVTATSLIEGTTISLTASAPTFESGHVGSYWQLGQPRTSIYVEKLINATGPSTPISIIGAWEFNTYGTWTAEISIQRSYDGGTSWETVRSYKSASDFNAAGTGKEDKEALLRINVTAFTGGSGRAVITAQESRVFGIAKITAVTSGTVATATVVRGLASMSATKFWSEGAWSTKRGFPRSVTLHEQRIYYAGTASRPQSVWGSVINDFETFRLYSNDDAGLFFTLSAQQANPIQWLLSQGKLLIGTAGEEWTLSSSDSNSAITPSNVQADRQSSYGSKYLRALIVNDVILFAQRQGRKVRELVFSFEQDGYRAPDLTMLAEHVTRGEILECAFAQQPDAIYWTITGAGQLVGMTYERDQNVVGWHRHTTGQRIEDGVEKFDTFESVATVYGASGADEVWFSIQREIDGQPVRTIERFKTDFRDTFETAAKPDWWYLDSARQSHFSAPATTITGLSHLEGRTVDILADGAVSPARTVQDATISLQAPARHVLTGLPYISQMKPMKLESPLEDGTSRGRIKKLHAVSLALYQSLGGQFSSDGTHWDWIYSRALTDRMDDSPPVFTGDKVFPVVADSSRSADITIRQTQPLPLTILALVGKHQVTGE